MLPDAEPVHCSQAQHAHYMPVNAQCHVARQFQREHNTRSEPDGTEHSQHFRLSGDAALLSEIVYLGFSFR